MKRLAFVLAAASCAAVSSAGLIQKFSKVYTINGSPVEFTDVLLRPGGPTEIYAWGTVHGADDDVVLIKINQAGQTQYINRLPLPGNQRSGKLCYDISGLFASYSTGPDGKDVALRQFNEATGATLGLLTYADPLVEEIDNGTLYRTYPQSVYWTFERVGADGRRLTTVYLPNANIGNPSVTSIRMPMGHSLLASKTRTVGLTFLIGSLAGGVGDGDLFFYQWMTPAAAQPLGYASALAITPVTDVVYTVGAANSNGLLAVSRIPDGGELGEQVARQASKPAIIRDAAVMEKQGDLIAVGSADTGGANGRNSFIARFDTQNGLPLIYGNTLSGGASNEEIRMLKTDYYDSLIGMETNDTNTNSRVLELDALTGAVVDAKAYPSLLKAIDMRRTEGFVAAAGDQGRVVLLQTRDLREMTVQSTVTGGQPVTLSIAMYLVHGIDRIVALSDNSPNLSLPAGKTVLAGSLSAQVTATTLPVVAPEIVTVTASYQGATRSARITLNP